MTRRLWLTLVTVVLLGLAQFPALAAGPVDGSFGVLWWQTDFQRGSALEDISADAGAPGYRGELWFFNKVGVRANLFSSDLGELNEDDADYISADVMWRLWSPTEKSFVAAGLGWQDMEFTESGLGATRVETAGVRATVEGRVGVIAVLYVYGVYSYLPELDDFSPGGGDRYTELEGQEYELGVQWKVAPFVDMRAGYRASQLDYLREPVLNPAYNGQVDSEGFMVGFGIHF